MKKRGVSLIISYVLLIVIAVSISAITYSYLKLRIPQEAIQCPDDTSLIVDNFVCNSAEGYLRVELSNRGLFNVSGVFIRFGESDRTVLQQLNKNQEIFQTPLAPGKNTPIYSFPISNILKNNTETYTLEIQPAVFKDRRIVPCSNSIVSQEVVCANANVSCGNSLVEGAEECDSSNFGIYNGSCSNYSSSWAAGNLECTNCIINTTNCT